jgi:homoserine O-acetyltransferase
MKIFGTVGAVALVLFSLSVGAAEYPAPKQGEWVARDFKFHTGEVMPELKLHYTTVGESSGTQL